MRICPASATLGSNLVELPTPPLSGMRPSPDVCPPGRLPARWRAIAPRTSPHSDAPSHRLRAMRKGWKGCAIVAVRRFDPPSDFVISRLWQTQSQFPTNRPPEIIQLEKSGTTPPRIAWGLPMAPTAIRTRLNYTSSRADEVGPSFRVYRRSRGRTFSSASLRG